MLLYGANLMYVVEHALNARMQHRPSASGYVYLPNFNIIGC